MNDATESNVIIETADESRSWRRRLLVAAGLATMVGAASVGVPAGVQALSTTPIPASAPATRAAQVNDGRISDDLGELTLAELAAELDELGLDVRIGPSSRVGSTLAPDEDWPDADWTDEDRTDEDWTDEDWPDEAEGEFDEFDVDDEDREDGSEEGSFDEEAALGAFAVDGDTIDLSSATSPEVADQAREIWERFVQLIPAAERQMITSFELVPEEFGGAYVYPADADPTKWVLGVGLGLGDDLDFVLVHEFGHLLSLKASEVPPASDENNCETYFTGEGCALPGTVMAEFVERFWPQAQIDEVNRATENEDYDALDDFYSDNSDDFVTDYAISNPAEDVADTFATFVIEDQPDNLGSPDLTIAEQKIEFFWSNPELVELREAIRASL